MKRFPRCALASRIKEFLSTRWCASTLVASRFFSSHSNNIHSLDRRIFKDRARINVSGGRGGHGCASMDSTESSRGKMKSGGNGGSVYLRGSSALQSFTFERVHFKGGNGEMGASRRCKGAHGRDAVVPVPLGTIVSAVVNEDELLAKGDEGKAELAALRRRMQEDDDRTGGLINRRWEQGEESRVYLRQLGEVSEEGQLLKVAEGGQGGQGNISFKSEAVYFSSAPTAGTEAWLMLELKLLADVGLVGYPNAGKSSLLCGLSRAKPKVAAYPFTTLMPYIGKVILPFNAKVAAAPAALPPLDEDGEYAMGGGEYEESAFTVADIPGLIDGAHQNVGLGHDFLRHIERTKVLLYVVDVAGMDGRDPVEDYKSLRRELGLYQPALLQRKALVLANKTDRKPKTVERNIQRLLEAMYKSHSTASSDSTGDGGHGKPRSRRARRVERVMEKRGREPTAVKGGDWWETGAVPPIGLVQGSALKGTNLTELVDWLAKLCKPEV